MFVNVFICRRMVNFNNCCSSKVYKTSALEKNTIILQAAEAQETWKRNFVTEVSAWRRKNKSSKANETAYHNTTVFVKKMAV